MIRVDHLSLTLDRTPVLNDVSFSASRGEYISLIGPNGAGKTTLLRCLLGMHRGHEGTIRLSGKPLPEYSYRELARIVSYVPQTHDIEFPLSVYEFVMMGRYPYLKPLTPPAREDIEAVEHALRITGCAAFRDRTLRTLSGGERQSVYIAAALAQAAPLILLDEPAAFLDYHHQAGIMRLLKKINAEHGATILAVNHDLNSAVRWSDRIIALKGGAAAYDGPPAGLLAPEKLAALFDIPFRLIPDGEHPLVTVDTAPPPDLKPLRKPDGKFASAS